MSDVLLKGLETIVQKYPNSPAIHFENTESIDLVITYEQLENRSNQIAKSLIKYRNKPIGFCMNRGPDFVVVMCAILKAGAYYVPLDKTYPIDRIKHIITDTKMPIIITNLDSNDELYRTLKELSTVLNIEDITTDTDSNSSFPLTNELAYITYTSGTTGKPKGVMIKRDSLLNLIMSAIRILNIDNNSNIFQYTSIGFDAAGWDIYIALLSGSTVHIANDRLAISPNDCHKYMKKHKMTMATLTPAFLGQMDREHIESLRILMKVFGFS